MGAQVSPVEIARQGLAKAKEMGVDAVIVDTAGGRLPDGLVGWRLVAAGSLPGGCLGACLRRCWGGAWSCAPAAPRLHPPHLNPRPHPPAGRLQVDPVLMQELKDTKAAVGPTDVLLVVDAMTGQEAASLVKTFNDEIDITGGAGGGRVCVCGGGGWRRGARAGLGAACMLPLAQASTQPASHAPPTPHTHKHPQTPAPTNPPPAPPTHPIHPPTRPPPAPTPPPPRQAPS